MALFTSLDFREMVHGKGVYITLELPNSNTCTQEMDQLYQIFTGNNPGQKLMSFFFKKSIERNKIIKAVKNRFNYLSYL